MLSETSYVGLLYCEVIGQQSKRFERVWQGLTGWFRFRAEFYVVQGRSQGGFSGDCRSRPATHTNIDARRSLEEEIPEDIYTFSANSSRYQSGNDALGVSHPLLLVPDLITMYRPLLLVIDLLISPSNCWSAVSSMIRASVSVSRSVKDDMTLMYDTGWVNIQYASLHKLKEVAMNLMWDGTD